MPAKINRQWILANRPRERVEASQFEWRESPVPEPREGEMLVRNLWSLLHPTQVLFLNGDSGDLSVPLGTPVRGAGAGRVVASKLPGFAPGDLLEGWFGWEDYTLSNGHGPGRDDPPPTKLPPDLPAQHALGAFGITGMAAYFGVLDIGKPASGETFVVDSAAGGVGSIAGQIAQIRGCRVVGIVSGRERRDWLAHELGWAGVIDRQSEDVGARLDALCPDGIDIYFDNTGLVPLLDLALVRLRSHGRVVLCGGTSVYCLEALPPGPAHYFDLILKEGRMEGIYGAMHEARFPEARAALAAWMREGRLKPLEDVAVGLENAPAAFARVFEGKNRGKQLLKIAETETE